MQNQATQTAQVNAKSLRREMTDSERRLWSRLRSEQLGVKFRRQHPLGNFIADFVCLDPKFIIELDGSQHQDQQAYDARREAFFRGQGFVVLRFGSNEPFLNLEGVLTVIHDAISTPHQGKPPSQPSPRGGRSNADSSSSEALIQSPILLLPPLGEGRDGGIPNPHIPGATP